MSKINAEINIFVLISYFWKIRFYYLLFIISIFICSARFHNYNIICILKMGFRCRRFLMKCSELWTRYKSNLCTQMKAQFLSVMWCKGMDLTPPAWACFFQWCDAREWISLHQHGHVSLSDVMQGNGSHSASMGMFLSVMWCKGMDLTPSAWACFITIQ